MKRTKVYEIEITRANVTPAQFLAYLRRMKKTHPEMSSDFDLDYFRNGYGNTISYIDATPDEKPCRSEICKDLPYEQQCYILNFDGSMYNEIIEFQFDDETTGFGYYYTVSYEVADEDRDANIAETLEEIAEIRIRKAEALEQKSDRIEEELARTNERYADRNWLDSKRWTIKRMREEAAELRETVAQMKSANAA